MVRLARSVGCAVGAAFRRRTAGFRVIGCGLPRPHDPRDRRRAFPKGSNRCHGKRVALARLQSIDHWRCTASRVRRGMEIRPQLRSRARTPTRRRSLSNSDEGERVSEANQIYCGAVDSTDRWMLILSAAFWKFFGGKVIGSPGRLADAVGQPPLFTVKLARRTGGVRHTLHKPKPIKIPRSDHYRSARARIGDNRTVRSTGSRHATRDTAAIIAAEPPSIVQLFSGA